MRIPARPIFRLAAVLAVAAPVVAAIPASGADDGPGHGPDSARPPSATAFTTVFTPPLAIEGLTGDSRGNLYSAGRGGDPCPVYRVPAGGGEAAVVGTIPAPCGPAGLTFGPDGRLYVADSGRVVVLRPDAVNPPAATVFAAGVPGANGLAFDRRGDLWVSDGTTGQGRVWRVGRDGVPAEAFRAQPMVNEVNLVNGVGGVGRDPRSAPPATVTVTPTGRSAANTEGSQHLVANGLAFTRDGALIVADTARGALWKVVLDHRGRLRTPTGCDTTFAPNTLCLDAVLVAHPLLEGVDGIVIDRAGTVWGAVNERNAVVTVGRDGRVAEYFRNAVDPATRLRNTGPMEFPTSPFLTGGRLCLTHSDGGRRDNFPNTGGEIGPQLPGRGKISCVR
ncbi:MAG TPA: SMP-30/gluconolactonase/LRE family protein [Pseudonocardiaceae bacterium]